MRPLGGTQKIAAETAARECPHSVFVFEGAHSLVQSAGPPNVEGGCAPTLRPSDAEYRPANVVFRRNFDRLTDKELKDLDRSSISDVIHQLKLLYGRNGHQYKVVTQLEYLDLELSYRYFKSPYFEKKLKGLTSLKEQLELIGKGKEHL